MLHNLNTSIQIDLEWRKFEKKKRGGEITETFMGMGTHMELLNFLSKACRTIKYFCLFKAFLWLLVI